MRTLERNKLKLWYVEPIENVEVVDSDGYYTGETKSSFGTPKVIYLNIYPYNGDINSDIFGKNKSFDMIGISNNLDLKENGLLFLSEPIVNKYLDYDYTVSAIKKSLNTTQYGLRGRV